MHAARAGARPGSRGVTRLGKPRPDRGPRRSRGPRWARVPLPGLAGPSCASLGGEQARSCLRLARRRSGARPGRRGVTRQSTDVASPVHGRYMPAEARYSSRGLTEGVRAEPIANRVFPGEHRRSRLDERVNWGDPSYQGIRDHTGWPRLTERWGILGFLHLTPSECTRAAPTASVRRRARSGVARRTSGPAVAWPVVPGVPGPLCVAWDYGRVGESTPTESSWGGTNVAGDSERACRGLAHRPRVSELAVA